jgi:hypothetical protein
MGKSSRQKRRSYQTPTRARVGANLVWYAAAAVLLVGGSIGVALSRSNSANGIAPTVKDHWHLALGVNDCGTWVPNWSWNGEPAKGPRYQAGTALYSPLHSHEDGLIHVEPQTDSQGGNAANLGNYFRYGGWKLSETSVQFNGVDEKNGNKCKGKPGVLRWSVNGKEQHGNPAKYKLQQGAVVELVFTTADAKLPPPTQVPSYANLQTALGLTPTSATTATTAPGTSSTGAATSSSAPTTVGATTTSKP